MNITYQAIKDPEFIGKESFDNYTFIESDNLIEHLQAIKEKIFSTRPENADKVIFYSMPDAKGMRFLRVVENDHNELSILSDFRYKWMEKK